MNDLISRQAAIEALKAHEDYKGYLHGDFEEILEALPSVQQDSKPGEWLHDLLQDAIDAGIITETQASRLIDMIDDSEDNT